MAKRKLFKFAQVRSFDNCFRLTYADTLKGSLPMKGKWNKEYFKNNNPIVVELGCGKGEYTVGLANRFPEKNFIGLDIKGNRIYTGAKMAIEDRMDNVAFIQTRVDFIESCFSENEIDEIWITFPDPQPSSTTVKQRLTNPIFLKRYKTILKKGGYINLKTDNEPFYNYTREVVFENKLIELDATNNLYDDSIDRPEYLTNIKTYYENKFTALGFKICYLKFKLE